MVVKKCIHPLDQIREILKDQNGILLTSDLSALGIPRTYLSILEESGEIQRIARGIYSPTDVITDDMAGLQARYRGAIFSHETALYLHELTDRTPLFYSVTVPTGYNATSLKLIKAKVFFVNRGLYPLGRMTVKSPHGNDIKTFDLERTVCDLVRSRNQIDIQIVNEALKKYVVHPARNIDLLYHYAIQFRIQKIIREYMEVLL
jgi:predicted transcriptional regulator of viral defense system